MKMWECENAGNSKIYSIYQQPCLDSFSHFHLLVLFKIAFKILPELQVIGNRYMLHIRIVWIV